MDKEIRIDDLCLDVAKSGAAVQMVKCHHMKGNQLWEFNEKVKNKLRTFASKVLRVSKRCKMPLWKSPIITYDS